MALVVWVPLLATMVTAIVGVIAYAWNKRVDRRNALIELRRTAYRNYLNSFMALSFNPDQINDVRRKLYQSEVELLIVGSDAVVQAVGKLSSFYAVTNHDRSNRDGSEVRRLVANVCMTMRADCFEKTDLSLEEIKALVPIA